MPPTATTTSDIVAALAIISASETPCQEKLGRPLQCEGRCVTHINHISVNPTPRQQTKSAALHTYQRRQVEDPMRLVYRPKTQAEMEKNLNHNLYDLPFGAVS